MDNFRRRNTTGFNYLRDKFASASVKMGLSGGDIPDLDIAVMKATNHNRVPPKEKHYQTIKFACSHGNHQEMLYTVNQLAEVLHREYEWVRVLKSLIIFHRLMRELDASFTDELINYMDKTRQRGMLSLDNFRDATTVDAFDFSAFVRVYSKYLDERTEAARPPLKYYPEHEVVNKSSSLRTMDTPDLLENLPKVLRLLTALLGVSPGGMATYDGAVATAMLMAIKESFKIYKTIQEGILNLLERFFEMNQVDATRGLQVYKDFNQLFERLSQYYKGCKQLMPTGVSFPELTPLPADLLQQMQDYAKEAKNPSVKKEVEEKVIVEVPKPAPMIDLLSDDGFIQQPQAADPVIDENPFAVFDWAIVPVGEAQQPPAYPTSIVPVGMAQQPPPQPYSAPTNPYGVPPPQNTYGDSNANAIVPVGAAQQPPLQTGYGGGTCDRGPTWLLGCAMYPPQPYGAQGLPTFPQTNPYGAPAQAPHSQHQGPPPQPSFLDARPGTLAYKLTPPPPSNPNDPFAMANQPPADPYWQQQAPVNTNPFAVPSSTFAPQQAAPHGMIEHQNPHHRHHHHAGPKPTALDPFKGTVQVKPQVAPPSAPMGAMRQPK